jgi:hypothetical protein
MCSGARRCPAGPLPAAHAHQLCRWSQLNNTINLAVGMAVVLPAINFVTLHVDSGNAEIAIRIYRKGNLATAIFRAVNLISGHPTFVVCNTLPNQAAEILIVRVPGPILAIQPLLKIPAWSPVDWPC